MGEPTLQVLCCVTSDSDRLTNYHIVSAAAYTKTYGAVVLSKDAIIAAYVKVAGVSCLAYWSVIM